MPRRKKSDSQAEVERELEALRDQSRALRLKLRKMRNSGTEIRKLEEKLTRQLGYAKYTIEQIQDLNANWDEAGFYKNTPPRKPAARGRKRKTETTA